MKHIVVHCAVRISLKSPWNRHKYRMIHVQYITNLRKQNVKNMFRFSSLLFKARKNKSKMNAVRPPPKNISIFISYIYNISAAETDSLWRTSTTKDKAKMKCEFCVSVLLYLRLSPSAIWAGVGLRRFIFQSKHVSMRRVIFWRHVWLWLALGRSLDQKSIVSIISKKLTNHVKWRIIIIMILYWLLNYY